MAYSILFGTFAILMVLGMPIAFCLGIASFATVLYLGIPPIVIFQQLNSGMNVFAMMAIPFFIFAGDLMVRGGIAFRLVRFASGFVGHMRGGLAQVNVVIPRPCSAAFRARPWPTLRRSVVSWSRRWRLAATTVAMPSTSRSARP